MLLEERQETEVHFLFGTVMFGLLSIFKKILASSPYEAFNSLCLSKAHRDVRSPVQMTLTPPAFSRVWHGIQTCLHLVRWKKSLNLHHCREYRPSFESGPFPVHSTWDRKHRVPLTSLLLRKNSSWGACGNLAHLFSQTGNQISSWDDMGCMELSSSCCTEINIHIDLRLLSQGISVVC